MHVLCPHPRPIIFLPSGAGHGTCSTAGCACSTHLCLHQPTLLHQQALSVLHLLVLPALGCSSYLLCCPSHHWQPAHTRCASPLAWRGEGQGLCPPKGINPVGSLDVGGARDLPLGSRSHQSRSIYTGCSDRKAARTVASLARNCQLCPSPPSVGASSPQEGWQAEMSWSLLTQLFDLLQPWKISWRKAAGGTGGGEARGGGGQICPVCNA